jgi:hypothetical protein
MMMGLAEEVEEDQQQQHSSFAKFIKNGALVASLSLALCLGSGQSLIPAFFLHCRNFSRSVSCVSLSCSSTSSRS